MLRLLWIGLVVFVTAGLLLVVIVATLDLDRFRDSIASAASEAVGRELSLSGPLELSLGRSVTLSAKDIAVANPDWAEDSHFLRAESIWIELETAALLTGSLVVSEARLSGIELDLESRSSGEANWDFDFPEDEARAQEPDLSSDLSVLVKRLLIEGSEIEYTGPLVDGPMNLVLHSVRQRLNDKFMLEMQLNASLNGEPVAVEMEVGDYSELEALGTVSLTLNGTAGQIEFGAQASVDELRTLAGPQGELSLHGPSFRYLAELLNLRSKPDGPLNLKASLVDGGDHHRLEAVGRLGSIDAVVRGKVDKLTAPVDANLIVEVSGDDFAGFEVLLGLPPGGPGPFSASMALNTQAQLNLSAELAGAKLNADGSLKDMGGDFSGSKFNIRVHGTSLMASLDTLGVTGLPDAPFNTRILLELGDGELSAPDITLQLGENTITGSVRGSFTDAEWTLQAPFNANLAAVSQLVPADTLSGELPPALRAMQLSGLFRADASSSELEQLRFSREDFDLELGARWPTSDPLSKLRLTLRGSGQSLVDLVPSLPPALESAFEVDGEFSLDHGNQLSGSLGLRGSEVSLSVYPKADISNQQLPIRLRVEAAAIGSDVSGQIDYTLGEVPLLSVVLESETLNLRPWVSLGGTGSDAGQQNIEAEVEAGAKQKPDPVSRVIPNTDISKFLMPELEVDFEYRVKRVETDLEYIENLRLESTLQAGALTIEELSFLGQGGGRLRASMGLEPLAGGLEVWLRVAGENISVGLPAQDSEEVAQLPRYDLALAYVASGTTVREMAAGSHGYLHLASGPGKVDISAMRIFTDDFLVELLNTVNPFASKNKYSNIECSTLLAVIEGGKLVGEPLLVVQSDRLQILADAKIDLGSEVVEADFNTVPMKGLGIGLSNLVHPYVNVRGSLANPVIGFDSTTALFSGGATVATGGLSILAKGLFDRMSVDKQACATAAAAAKEKFDRLEALYGSAKPKGEDS